MIRFACPACNGKMQAPEGKVGRKGTCPKCGAAFTVTTCPGCGRAIPLLPHELSFKVVCSGCERAFIPGTPTPTSSLGGAIGTSNVGARMLAEDVAEVLPAEAPASSPGPAKRRGFPLWVLAIFLPAGFLVLCCGGVGFLAFLGGSSGGGRSDVPPSDPEEVAAFVKVAGEGYSAAGTQIPLKTFTVRCKLSEFGPINRHPDLLTVLIELKEPNSFGNPVIAYAEKHGGGGRDIIGLLGDGGWHTITVELGTPQRRIGTSGVVEVVRAWKYGGK